MTHIVFVPLTGWGHLRPSVHLALALLRANESLTITLLPDRRGVGRIEQQLSLYPDTRRRLGLRLKVTPVQDNNVSGDLSDDLDAIDKEFRAGYAERFEAACKEVPPQRIIMDMFRVLSHFDESKSIMEKLGLTAKIHLYFPSNLESIQVQVPDGLTQIPKLAQLQALHKSDEAAAAEMERDMFDPSKLEEVLDIPQRYAYEVLPNGNATLTPQAGPDVVEPTSDDKFRGMLKQDAFFKNRLLSVIEKADAVITHACPEVEPNSAQRLQDLAQKKTGGPDYFHVGYIYEQPEAAEPFAQHGNNRDWAVDDGRVTQFLAQALEAMGPRSVVYISFGTVAWPSSQTQIVQWLLEGLLSHGYYVLVAVASAKQNMSATTRTLLSSHERVLTAGWVSQSEVLLHEATAFFVTHAGAGSYHESIAYGIPTVLLPQGIDQVYTAALLERFGAGARLYQFCPYYHGRTLANGVSVQFTEQSAKGELAEFVKGFRGQRGDEMRQKVGELRDILQTSGRTGRSAKDLERLAHP